MICALDIGNSAIKGGFFKSGELVDSFREPLGLDTEATAAKIVSRLSAAAVVRVGVSSVVPVVTEAIASRLTSLQPAAFFRVTHRVRLPFEIAYETPETMGVDRIAAAAGAHRLVEPGAARDMAVAVIDSGTATTIDLIDGGRLLGGPVLPGPELLRRAVRSGTAQLPEVDLVWPERVISRSTEEAVNTGVMMGFVDSVRGMLLRVIDELGRQPAVVVTGGWSELLAERISLIGTLAPHLVIRGVDLLMRLNPEGAHD